MKAVLNKGCMAQYDTNDQVLVNRLVFVTFRSRFFPKHEFDALAEPRDENTYVVDPDIAELFMPWRSALLDLLMGKYDSKFDVTKVPSSMFVAENDPFRICLSTPVLIPRVFLGFWANENLEE
jgi:hypothetical protein